MTHVAPGYEAVASAFDAIGEADPTYSAQLTVYRGAEVVLDLTGPTGLGPDTLLPVFSSSKGATAIVIGLLVERGQLDLDEKVATYWPEFAANGKGAIPVRQLLSHQAGLPGVDGGFTWEDVFGHTALAERLAAQRPLWRPGAGFMYHGLTIGTLADELCRRIDGRPVGQVLREDVTASRGIDIWMGTPASEDQRIAEVQLPNADELAAFFAEMATAAGGPPDTLGAASMPAGQPADLILRANTSEFHRAGSPAATMLATGRGLAKLYACVRHDLDGPRILSDDTIGQLRQIQVSGTELATNMPARFGVLFQVPISPRWPFGSHEAFGHDGAGGSLAFADPRHDIAFGYSVQRLPLPGGMDMRAVELARLVREVGR